MLESTNNTKYAGGGKFILVSVCQKLLT